VGEKCTILAGSGKKMYIFWAEVAERHTFFGQNWLKNICFLCGTG
jgi:hypothetical protein